MYSMKKFAHRRSITQEEREAIIKAESMIDANSTTWVEDFLKNKKAIHEEESQ